MANPLQALGDLNKLRQQAKKMQDDLAAESITVEEGDIVVTISGDQKVKHFSVQGISSDAAVELINKGIKRSQELAAKKLQEMSGGLSGLLGGGAAGGDSKNPLKALGDLNKLRQQAKKMQDELSAELITMEEGDLVLIIAGDQKIKQFSVQGISSQEAIEVLNKAIKQSQEMAAKKLQQMTGGLGGMLGGGAN